MRSFSLEELERLKEAESYFKTAVYSDYKRATTNKIDEMVIEVYTAAGGDGKFNRSCGVCSLHFYKKVGTKYFNDKEIVGKELEPKNINNTISTTYTTTDNNEVANKERKDGMQNRGRKKKTQQ